MLAELFVEMLQRDFGYRIYKTLLSLPEKVVSPPEPEKEEAAKEDVVKEEETVKEEAVKVSKDEVQNEGTAAESDSTLVSTVLSPGLDQGPHMVKLSMIRAPHVSGCFRNFACLVGLLLCYPVFGDGLSEAQGHESLHVSTQLGRGMSGVREVALKREGSMSNKPWQHRNASQSPQELGLPMLGGQTGI